MVAASLVILAAFSMIRWDAAVSFFPFIAGFNAVSGIVTVQERTQYVGRCWKGSASHQKNGNGVLNLESLSVVSTAKEITPDHL